MSKERKEVWVFIKWACVCVCMCVCTSFWVSEDFPAFLLNVDWQSNCNLCSIDCNIQTCPSSARAGPFRGLHRRVQNRGPPKSCSVSHELRRFQPKHVVRLSAVNKDFHGFFGPRQTHPCARAPGSRTAPQKYVYALQDIQRKQVLESFISSQVSKNCWWHDSLTSLTVGSEGISMSLVSAHFCQHHWGLLGPHKDSRHGR